MGRSTLSAWTWATSGADPDGLYGFGIQGLLLDFVMVFIAFSGGELHPAQRSVLSVVMRRQIAFVQDRTAPTGWAAGSLQWVADAIKMIVKESSSRRADRLVSSPRR